MRHLQCNLTNFLRLPHMRQGVEDFSHEIVAEHCRRRGFAWIVSMLSICSPVARKLYRVQATGKNRDGLPIILNRSQKRDEKPKLNHILSTTPFSSAILPIPESQPLKFLWQILDTSRSSPAIFPQEATSHGDNRFPAGLGYKWTFCYHIE